MVTGDLVAPDALAMRMQYAKALAASNLLPRAYQAQPANVLVAIEYGNALGLAPMVAIQTIHVVDGKPTASAQLIGGLVRRAGHRLRVIGDGHSATAQIVRADDPEYVFTATWTLERAQAAGLLGKGSWKAYPDAMLKARAITEVARDACPEVLAGVAYTAEELGVDERSAHTVYETQPTWEAPTTTAEAVQRLEAAGVEVIDLGQVVHEEDFTDEPARAQGSHRSSASWTPKQRKWVRDFITRAAKDQGYQLPDLAQLDVLSAALQRPLESLDDVSFSEASQLIDNIQHSAGAQLVDALLSVLPAD